MPTIGWAVPKIESRRLAIAHSLFSCGRARRGAIIAPPPSGDRGRGGRVVGLRTSAAVAALAALCAAPARAEGPAAEPAVLLENARILPVSGPAIPRGSILLRGGRIAAVGAGLEAPPGARRVDLAGATVCPGFVDAGSRAGLAPGDRAGAARDPDAPASDGLDLRDPALAAARAAGVTTLVLSPGAPAGQFAGRLSAVKTAPGGGNEGRVLEARGALKAVVGVPGAGSSLDRAQAAANLRAAFRGAVEAAEAREKHARDLREFLREAAKWNAAGDAPEESLLPPAVIDRLRRLDPEPRERARKALRSRLGLREPEKPAKPPERPREPRADPARELLLAATRGEVAVRFEVAAVEDLRAALDLAREFRLRATLEGGPGAARAAADLAKAKIPFALRPSWGPGEGEDGPAASAAPALLAAAGTRTSLATGGGGPLAARHLPILAARAAGQGLDRDAALRAITLAAAAAAGLEERLGSLDPGKDADLLVLDGDPLAAATRVTAVWIDGVEVPR
jgi:imidazolonepropionase-like amidohydrolase